jgi:hypothetical protein
MVVGRRKLRAGPGEGYLCVRIPKGSADVGSVSIKIGAFVFDDALYDAENDVLYLSVGAPEKGEGEATPEGHVIRYAPGTDRVVGITLLGPRRILERDGRLMVTMPEAVETADLASLLTAA